MSTLLRTRQPLVGQLIGNYRIVRLLGEGAMGQVYLGEHPQIGRQVAVKVISPDLSGRSEMAERFVAEARAVNHIHHPNIIEIYDFGSLADGRLYYTMELLHGRELGSLIAEQGSLDLSLTDRILQQVANALDAAHAAGIVHRDLKPENILILGDPADPRVKILDFGIAKLTETTLGAQSRTATGMIMGTPLYMSPEQAAGRVDQISPASDVYALGIILYQMLSGRLPFSAPTAAQIMAAHITAPPPPITEVTEGLPAGIQSVLECSLAKDPSVRFQTAGSFYQVYNQTCRVALDSTQPLQLPYDATLASDAGTPAAASISRVPARRSARLLGLSIPVVALAVVAAVWVLRDRDVPVPPQPEPPATAPASQPRAPVMNRMEQTTPPVLRHRLRVTSPSRGIQTEVLRPGQPIMSHTPPFEVQVRHGDRVQLRSSGTGYQEHQETFVVTADRTVDIRLKRRRSRRKRRQRSVAKQAPAKTPKPAGAPMKPEPKKTMKVGESTLSPY